VIITGIAAIFGAAGGAPLTTVFYVLSGWLLFNVVFAVAMYFRPIRKPAVGPADSSETRSDVRPQLSKAGDDLIDAAASAPDSQKKIARPAILSRVLFFGFWLNDHRHSA
jgi:hypothetical protein